MKKEMGTAFQTAEEKKMPTAAAYASILTSAALWGLSGMWNRYLMAAGLSSYTTAALRNLGGLTVLLIIFLVKDRSVFRMKKDHLKYFFGTGVISVTMFTACYFSCQKFCSLAVASVLLYTAPSFVVVLSAILWKEPITKKKLAALGLTLVGCACACGLFSGGMTVTGTGVLLGLGAGFFYALYSIFGRYALRAGYNSMAVTVWTFLFAGPASLIFLQPPEINTMTSSMWLLALGMGLFSTALPYLLYTAGLSSVESGKASIMASLEPVVASLAGVLIFGEPMGILTLVGIICVLAGVYILR